MSRYDRQDIMMELIELSQDLKSEILQQLNYYRASVYKSETSVIIEGMIEQLKLLGDLIGDDELQDAFLDYEAMRRNGPMLVAPGECLLSLRTMALLKATDLIFQQLITRQAATASPDTLELSRNIQKHRGQLLSLCRQGSRQWAFFNRL